MEKLFRTKSAKRILSTLTLRSFVWLMVLLECPTMHVNHLVNPIGLNEILYKEYDELIVGVSHDRPQ